MEDDDPETSMYFNNGQPQPGVFRERDNMYATSGSPSQSFTPTSNLLYQQQSLSNRGYNGSTAAAAAGAGVGYQRSTPTTMLQPQSPNRNNALGNMVIRSFPHMSQQQQQFAQNMAPQQQSIQKRIANASSYSGFGQPQAFSFPQQQSRTGGSMPSGSDVQQSSQVGIDLSSAEFPSLGSRSIAPQPTMLNNGRDYVGMVGGNNKGIETGGEFSMLQEDFPALPGSIPPLNGPEPSKQPPANTEATTLNTKDSLSNLRSELKTTKGVQTLPDGTVTNIPAGMLTDQFGMVGLLTFIRAAETDANLVALAPGVDLTTLGLNLNSVDNLYSTFQSPWADGPCRPQDIDYHVPSEYLTNAYIREKLSDVKFNKYGEDLLFYLFYCNPGDGLQMAASVELYNRDWRFHKEEQVWITRAAGMEPHLKMNTFEKGHYYVFNPTNWRKELKELHLEYSKLEEKRLSQANQQQQQSSQQQQQQQQQMQQQQTSTSVAANH